eukprot:scaffold12199_cov63-Phaeocystis_antarctica.AAC.1
MVHRSPATRCMHPLFGQRAKPLSTLRYGSASSKPSICPLDSHVRRAAHHPWSDAHTWARGAHLRTDTFWCSRRGAALVRCFGEVLRSRAPRDAVRPVGWPHNLQASRGQGPSLPRARTTRRTAKFLACCVRRAPGDRQAAHGRPGQQRPFRPPAASLASSCPISSPWPAAAGGGSGRMSRPSGRRPSSCDQYGSTAATEPRRGRPQVRWSTAMDGELGARGRAARATGRSAGCRGARRRGTPPLRYCLLAHAARASLPGRSRLLKWLAGERRRRRSTPPAAARPFGSEAAPRACAACSHASECTVRERARSMAPRPWRLGSLLT